MSRLLITIQGSADDTARAREVVDRALTAAGFPPAQPTRHLHAVPDVPSCPCQEHEFTRRGPSQGPGGGAPMMQRGGATRAVAEAPEADVAHGGLRSER